MKIEKDIKLFNDNESISVVYTKENFETTDTDIAVYDKYKISILLSEGLNAVVGDKVIKSGKNSDMKIFSLMLRIVLLCSDFYEKQKYNPIDFQMPDIVTGTMMYISENYKDKLSLEKLASMANCSVTYLSRIFKQYVGMTIYNYIIATRIGNAQIMLNEDVSVTEVCFACGFDDCSNFIRTFKKITGKTPLQFQKSLNM